MRRQLSTVLGRLAAGKRENGQNGRKLHLGRTLFLGIGGATAGGLLWQYHQTGDILLKELGNIYSLGKFLQQRADSFSFDRYHRVAEIESWLEQVVSDHPNLATLLSIGKTHEGRDIYVIRVSKADNVARKAIFLEGGLHAREWISPATLLFLLNDLLRKDHDEGCDILDLVDVYILPLANPDGYEFSQTSRRMWRKNRSPCPAPPLSFLGFWKGTDLNRNFPCSWGAGVGSTTWLQGSSLPFWETYIGSAPASELETQAIMDFLEQHKTDIEAYLAIHSFGNLVIHPSPYYSHLEEEGEDAVKVDQLGKSLASSLEQGSGGADRYRSGPANKLNYSTVGSAADWARFKLGTRWVFTVELPDEEDGFFLPAENIPRVGQSLKAMLETLATYIKQDLDGLRQLLKK